MSRIQDLEALLDESPDDPFLIFALAREHEKFHNTLQALLMYEHLVGQHPDYIATYYHYAKLLLEAGNRTEGLRLLRQGIDEGIKAADSHAVNEMRALLGQWTVEEE